MDAEIPAWVSDYIGLPWRERGRDRDGLDCWGLLRLVLRERGGCDVPAYDGVGFQEGCDRAALARFMAAHQVDWTPVAAGAERTGDGVMLRVAGQPIHVGVVVAPGWMLHIERGVNSCRDRYDGLKWRRRVMGFYRWAGPRC